MASRILAKKPEPKVKVPRNPDEWRLLMQKAISLAETGKDRRLNGFRKAYVEGNNERHLRKLNIISENCLNREFPKT